MRTSRFSEIEVGRRGRMPGAEAERPAREGDTRSAVLRQIQVLGERFGLKCYSGIARIGRFWSLGD